jgi:ABC-type uncharacterized transport system permease subunit
MNSAYASLLKRERILLKLCRQLPKLHGVTFRRIEVLTASCFKFLSATLVSGFYWIRNSLAQSFREYKAVKYRVSIKSFPDYKHLLKENYVEYKHVEVY